MLWGSAGLLEPERNFSPWMHYFASFPFPFCLKYLLQVSFAWVGCDFKLYWLTLLGGDSCSHTQRERKHQIWGQDREESFNIRSERTAVFLRVVSIVFFLGSRELIQCNKFCIDATPLLLLWHTVGYYLLGDLWLYVYKTGAGADALVNAFWQLASWKCQRLVPVACQAQVVLRVHWEEYYPGLSVKRILSTNFKKGGKNREPALNQTWKDPLIFFTL